jgi:heme/copper-type cytochrome/quinol oxidase subunit 2
MSTLQQPLAAGAINTVAFTPNKKGTFVVTCPYGHLVFNIIVK